MRNQLLRAGAAAMLLLSGCAAPAPSRPAAHVDTDIDQSGRPYAGPVGVRSSFPPADNNAQSLLCHPDGPATVCARSP